jgi:hypothetical protein
LVLYAEVVAAYQAIEVTTSRLRITEVLVRLLRAAPRPAGDTTSGPKTPQTVDELTEVFQRERGKTHAGAST